ncbi:MAG: pyridoxamine 5'-phosphate oxidase family protein [Pseudomonadota bacterium]
MTDSLKKTDRTSISRHSERASYDRAQAFQILDEGLIAHVGLDAGNGVIVIPMTYARIDDELILHGAVASRWLSALEKGLDICVSVTLLDGLVLARSAFSHSMNYRSVVAFGSAELVSDDEEKMRAFRALLDHLLPGRWEDSRQPDRKEIGATTVIKLRIDEASIKVRSGDPVDSAKDCDLPYWAGVIPLSLEAGAAIPDAAMEAGRDAPGYTAGYARR